MADRLIYQDHTAALTTEALVVRGYTKILGRRRRIPLTSIASFKVRARSDFPGDRLPAWGLSDNDVWYTRDRHRWRRRAVVEVELTTGDKVGFSPAHANRVRDLLVRQGVTEQ